MKSIVVLIITTIFSLSSLPAAAEPIRIGAILPLTGAVAPWGERVKAGLITSNSLLGNRFAITFEDEGECEGQKALTAYRKLVTVDKVKIIFVNCLSGVEAIVPLAAKDSVLLLSLGLLNDYTIHAGAQLVDLANEVGTEAKLLAEYVLQEKPERIAGVFFEDAFGREFSNVLSEHLSKEGHPFVSRESAAAQIDSFKSLIVRWKKLKVDLLITTLSDRQAATLIREMQELGFKPKIFSSYILECYAPSPKDRVPYEGIKYTHPVNASEGSPEYVRYNTELAKHEKPGQLPNINAFFAYDGFIRLNSGIEQCKAVDPTCLYRYFTSLGSQHGISGEMYFEPTGALIRPYGLKIVKNGEFVWLEKRGLSPRAEGR